MTQENNEAERRHQELLESNRALIEAMNKLSESRISNSTGDVSGDFAGRDMHKFTAFGLRLQASSATLTWLGIGLLAPVIIGMCTLTAKTGLICSAIWFSIPFNGIANAILVGCIFSDMSSYARKTAAEVEKKRP